MDEELLAAVGLNSSKFPSIVMPGTKVGYYKNIPVFAVAGHDTASAVAAVPSEDEKFAYLSSGTWSLMGIEVQNPILTERARKSNFTNEGGVGGTIRFLKNITGMWILEQCRKEWKESGTVYSYDEIVKMVEEEESLKSFIDPDDDSFANPKSMVEAILSFCAEHDMPLPKTHSQILRCIMESLALKYRFVFETLKDIAPFPLNRLHIIGGGAKNNLLNQFTANSLGVSVYAGPSEATAIGNIMLQCKALGIVGDMADMKKMIRESIKMQVFIPSDKEKWDVAYEIYKKYCL
jgi:rhamnulokinase